MDYMKEMCVLLSADEKRYSFFFNQLRDGNNVGRDEYTITIISTMDILIHIEVVIQGNQQSTHEIAAAEGGATQKDAWVTHFHINSKEAPKKTQHWSLEET